MTPIPIDKNIFTFFSMNNNLWNLSKVFIKDVCLFISDKIPNNTRETDIEFLMNRDMLIIK